MTRKPWMDTLRSHRFTRDGTMTTDTAKAWRAGSDYRPVYAWHYAEALGISEAEAEARISRQSAIMHVEEIEQRGLDL